MICENISFVLTSLGFVSDKDGKPDSWFLFDL